MSMSPIVDTSSSMEKRAETCPKYALRSTRPDGARRLVGFLTISCFRQLGPFLKRHQAIAPRVEKKKEA